MGIWIRTALEPAVVKRAVKYALVVGVILVLINYLDILIVGTLEPAMLLKMLLNFVVPYLVSTSSSVAVIKESRAGDVGVPGL